jgi:hypothetical protein
VPLDNPTVAAAGLDLYMPASRLGRAGKAIAQSLLKLGVGRIMPRGQTAILGHVSPVVQEILRLLNLDFREVSLAFVQGTAGPEQKLTVQIMTCSGAVCAYAKIGTTDIARRALDRESQQLRLLSNYQLSDATPSLIGDFDIAGWRVVLMSAGPHRGSGNRMSSAHWQFLGRLEIPGRLAFHRYAQVNLKLSARLEHLTHILGKPAINPLHESLRKIGEVADFEVRACLGHGDFAPWNIRLHESRGASENLFVFDWEHGTTQGFPLFDALHFLTQTGILLKSRDGRSLVDALLNEMKSAAATRYLEHFGVAASCLEAVFRLYLVQSTMVELEIGKPLHHRLVAKRLDMLGAM